MTQKRQPVRKSTAAARTVRDAVPSKRPSKLPGEAAPASRLGGSAVADAAPLSEATPSSRREEESAADSMLSRYFRDMATHQVMGPDEELIAAQAVERTEVSHWATLLSYLPAAEHLLDRLEAQVNEISEEDRPDVGGILERMRGLLELYRKQRSKLHADQLRTWHELSEELARAIR